MDAKQALSGLQGGASRSMFRVLDSLGKPRASISADGTVSGADGQVMAYIEADGTVGDAMLNYLGEVHLLDFKSEILKRFVKA